MRRIRQPVEISFRDFVLSSFLLAVLIALIVLVGFLITPDSAPKTMEINRWIRKQGQVQKMKPKMNVNKLPNMKQMMNRIDPPKPVGEPVPPAAFPGGLGRI